MWTLEGSTGRITDNNVNPENRIRSGWQLERATFSLACGIGSEAVPAEEVLLEGTDISLAGTLVLDDNDRPDRDPLFRLQPGSALLSIGDFSIARFLTGRSNDDKHRIGRALQILIAYLDGIVSGPNLHLSLPNMNDDKETSKVRSFEDCGCESGLGGALKRCLRCGCGGTRRNRNGAIATGLPALGESMAAFGAIAAMETSNLVAVTAMAAKDGVEAAARRGREIRQRKAARTGLRPTKTRDGGSGNRFGDITRGLVRSIHLRAPHRNEDGAAGAGCTGEEQHAAGGDSSTAGGVLMGMLCGGRPVVGDAVGFLVGSKGGRPAVYEKRDGLLRWEHGAHRRSRWHRVATRACGERRVHQH